MKTRIYATPAVKELTRSAGSDETWDKNLRFVYWIVYLLPEKKRNTAVQIRPYFMRPVG